MGAAEADSRGPLQLLQAVARDLEGLKGAHAPLSEFSARRHLDAAALRIAYQHRVRPPRGGGGWTGAVPAPEAGGVWLHIDVHSPASTLQIHTQPATEPLCFGELRVAFLVREGAGNTPLAPELRSILARHGVERCRA